MCFVENISFTSLLKDELLLPSERKRSVIVSGIQQSISVLLKHIVTQRNEVMTLQDPENS